MFCVLWMFLQKNDKMLVSFKAALIDLFGHLGSAEQAANATLRYSLIMFEIGVDVWADF